MKEREIYKLGTHKIGGKFEKRKMLGEKGFTHWKEKPPVSNKRSTPYVARGKGSSTNDQGKRASEASQPRGEMRKKRKQKLGVEKFRLKGNLERPRKRACRKAWGRPTRGVLVRSTTPKAAQTGELRG